MPCSRRLLPMIAVLGCCAVPLPAQDQPDFRSIRASEAVSAPVLDGVPDDSCWARADWQEGFFQLKPDPGLPARAMTRVAVLFDRDHLYAAFRCLNPDGAAANSRLSRRDADMDQDNAVTLYLDTFHTRRDCYYFSTNSLGTQVEGRIGEDGGTNDKSWDCAWRVVAHEDSLGWSAELAIPVSELRLPPGATPVWGVNFRRNYPEGFETSFWRRRDVAWRVSQSGDLTGLEGLSRRFSAQLFPYLVGLAADPPAGTERRTMLRAEGRELIGGADLRLRLGGTADANFTFNPDFATVEADLEVINLTRYETFYPEKRLFFLEGAELFSNPINLFYSRRIGEMDWGVKGNGRAGSFNWAALGGDERSLGAAPGARTAALRLQRDVLGSSSLGFTMVERSLEGAGARLFSTDGALVVNPRVKLSGQYVGSLPTEGGQYYSALFLRAVRETGLFNSSLQYSMIEPGFRERANRVGFIPDDDRHDLESTLGGEHWVRRFGIDKLNFNQSNNLLWSHDGDLRAVHLGGWVGVTFLDKWLVGVANNFDTELFEKRYRNHTRSFEAGWNLQQWNTVNMLLVNGRSFDRDMTRLRVRGNIKPWQELGLSAAATRLWLDPDPNRQATRLFELSGDYYLTPDLWLRLVSLYNTANRRCYLYGLLGWRFIPPFGALYLAYTSERYNILDDRPLPVSLRDDRVLFLKLTIPLSLY